MRKRTLKINHLYLLRVCFRHIVFKPSQSILITCRCLHKQIWSVARSWEGRRRCFSVSFPFPASKQVEPFKILTLLWHHFSVFLSLSLICFFNFFRLWNKKKLQIFDFKNHSLLNLINKSLKYIIIGLFSGPIFSELWNCSYYALAYNFKCYN